MPPFVLVYVLFFCPVIDTIFGETEVKHQFENGNTELDCKNGTEITAFICLLPGYEKGVSPKLSDETSVQVKVQLYVNHIREINVIDRYMSFDITLRLEWVDNRVAKKFTKENVELKVNKYWYIDWPIESLKKIWLPDLNILNMKQFETFKLIPSATSLRIVYDHYSKPAMEYAKNNTRMLYFMDATVTVYCLNFEFTNFPFEENNCTFLLFSYNPADFILGEWYFNPGLGKVVNGYRINNVTWISKVPVDVNPEWSWAGTGKAIGFNLCMKRKLIPFLLQYYIPSMAIVILTQISFIIPISAIPGRVALLVTEFLTMTNLFIHQQVNLSF